MTAALFGHGELGTARRDAAQALTTAQRGLATIDTQVALSPILTSWGRLEREVAGVQAVAESGRVGADLQSILSARLGALLLPPGHVGLGDLDARSQRWAHVRGREGEPTLRGLVRSLAPVRGSADLVAFAEHLRAALGQVSSSLWQVSAGQGGRQLAVESATGPDLADLVLAVPFALRRAGLTRQLLPAVSGRIRVFASEDMPPLVQLARWAETLAGQAGQGAARLRLIERYVASADARLIEVRRPAALRRLVDIGLHSWSLWAAQLARVTKVNISSAWRTLEHAAELGLVQPMPGQGASRGNGTLYAIPPWLQLAGLISAPRGRPAAPSRSQIAVAPEPRQHFSALDEVDAAIAAADQVLARGILRPATGAGP